MIDMDTLWDTGSVDTSGVLDTLPRTGYQVVPEDTVVCSNIQGYTLAHGGLQCSFRAFPPRGPHDRDLEHTIKFGLPRIGEMGELQRVVSPSLIDLHLGYRQMRDRKQDTHMSTSRLHYEFLVMPLGLTNARVTFQSYRQ
jgi:hypothetical protein